MAARKHGVKAPATESLVAGANWESKSISGEQHTRVEFVTVDLTEAKNVGSVFAECTFRNCKFNVSSHKDAAFINCTFKSCSFFDTKFYECKFVGSMFDRCTYDLMEVLGGNWSHVGLPGANLNKATFSHVRLREADLTGARAEGGSIRDCDMSGAWLHNANLTDCDLRGSDLSAIDPESTQYRGAVITMNQAITIATALGLDVRAE